MRDGATIETTDCNEPYIDKLLILIGSNYIKRKNISDYKYFTCFKIVR